MHDCVMGVAIYGCVPHEEVCLCADSIWSYGLAVGGYLV